MSAPNAELAYRILDQIDAHPDSWDQGVWDCGTSACFAGWAVRLSGGSADMDAYVVDGPPELVGMHVETAARTVLRLDDGEDEVDDGWLFGPDNDREGLGRMVDEIFGPRPGGEA